MEPSGQAPLPWAVSLLTQRSTAHPYSEGRTKHSDWVFPRARWGTRAPKEAQTQSRAGPVSTPFSRLIARQGIVKFRV